VIFLLIYLVGLPLMFWLIGREAWYAFGPDPWDRITWGLVLFITLMWPFSWVVWAVIFIVRQSTGSVPRGRTALALSRKVRPKELDIDDRT